MALNAKTLPDDEYFFLKIFDSSRRYSPGREAVVA